MFKADWIENYFSRVKPRQVLAIWLPIVAYCLWQSFANGAALGRLGLFMAAGVLFWTFLEYVLHRFVFHFEPHGPVQEDLSFLIHGIHHDYPWDADRLVMPPTISLAIGAMLWLPMKYAVGETYFTGMFAGVALGYLWYDLGHYAAHHIKPRTRVGRWLRSYHLVHHFKTPGLRYGVSTPLWDLVFGTYPTEQRDAAYSKTAVQQAQPAE